MKTRYCPVSILITRLCLHGLIHTDRYIAFPQLVRPMFCCCALPLSTVTLLPLQCYRHTVITCVTVDLIAWNRIYSKRQFFFFFFFPASAKQFMYTIHSLNGNVSPSVIFLDRSCQHSVPPFTINYRSPNDYSI